MSFGIKDPSWLVQGSLALAVAGAAAVYGLSGAPSAPPATDAPIAASQGDSIDDDALHQVLPGVPTLPGSTEVDPTLVVVNGARVNLIRAWSDRRPIEIIDQFEKLARGQGAREVSRGDAAEAYSASYGPNLPAIQTRSLTLAGQALRTDTDRIHAITWLDPRGRRICVHAMAGEERGSWYYESVYENPTVLFGAAAGRDNPGSDCPGIPRPPLSRRLISFSGYATSAFQTAVYESKATAEVTHRYYREMLPGQGWTPTELPAPGRDILDRSGAQLFRRDQSLVCVFVDRGPEDIVQVSVVLFEAP